MAGLQTQTVSSGKIVFVATDEPERDSKGPFYVVYLTGDAEDRRGYLYGNCDSFDTAIDTIAHIECNNCGNVRKPREWDAVRGQPSVSARSFTNCWYGIA